MAQRTTFGLLGNVGTQGHRGGTDNRNLLTRDSLLPVPQTVYYQQGSQAPIFNGPIAGGVAHYHTSSMDPLQILYDHSATGATHDSGERYPPPMCHPGTREAVIIRIADWFGYQQGPGKPIMWVHAPAGYGKTAIAGTVSKMLEEIVGLNFSPLGATFFFWRSSFERNNPTRFIITIAYQLAVSIPELQPHIRKAISRNPMILGKALEVQLVKLIVEPFKAIGDLQNIPNRLVVIDGLDECINSEQESRVEKKYAEDQEKIQVQVLDLIYTLQSHRLPLSFLILSRPDAWITRHIESRLFKGIVEIVDLYAVGDHMNDVRKYVRGELCRIAANIEDDSEEWPTENIVRDFIRTTNGHMLYASTVIRHIDDPYDDPRKRLKDILNASKDSNHDLAYSTPFSSLYELYRQILRSYPESTRSLMVEVLEDIVVTSGYFGEDFAPRSAFSILNSLSGRAAGSEARAIRGLHAVLRLVPNPTDPKQPEWPPQSLNPFIHSSFVEFLASPVLSSEFAIDKKKGSRRLLVRCLECLSTITKERDVRSEPGHFCFAIFHFRSLWVTAWSSEEDVRSCEDEYVQVVKRLLTVDLKTCFIHLLGSLAMELYPTFPFIFVSDYTGRQFLRSLEYLPKRSDPLVQQAISHVLSSRDGAVGYLLDRSELLWPRLYEDELQTYLNMLYNRSANSNRWKSDEVTRALSDLQRDLEKLRPGPRRTGRLGYLLQSLSWTSCIRTILDYIRQDVSDPYV